MKAYNKFGVGVNDFPKIGAPALRALHNAKITKLNQLTKYTEKELLELHGMGPKALVALRSSLKAKGLSLAEEKSVTV